MTSIRTNPAWLLAVLLAAPVQAADNDAVSVRIGPTDIPRGEARGERDITVRNGRFAVAFAVDTAPPWGIARGGIIDVAEVRGSTVGPDRTSLVDFMPNNWSSWPTTYQRVTIEENTPELVRVRTERDWESAELVTTWEIRADSDLLHTVTRMHNRGDKPYAELLSGYVLWPKGGYIASVPGTTGMTAPTPLDPLLNWTAAYDRDWMLGLHTPFADRIGTDPRDRLQQHALPSGETREFEAWLQVASRGELAPLVKTRIEIDRLPSGTVEGEVRSTAGMPVAAPAIVVERALDGASVLFTWTLGAHDGRYRIELPAGQYRIYASAEAHSNSAAATIEVGAGKTVSQQFIDLQPPGRLALHIAERASGRALDARISIESGSAPVVQFFGRSTFFTELERIGLAELEIAPGDYRFRISAGGGFTTRPQVLEQRVQSGQSASVDVAIEQLANPRAGGWIAADLHHHSDVLDGFTEPKYVLRSQLAAGLDLAFLSDHDSVVNNAEMRRLASMRGLPFIPASEFSPSWAHFNGYPLDDDKTIEIDVGRSPVQAIFAEARRMGARVVAVNHPYINYGYFLSQKLDKIPGGYSDAFDLVEITAADANAETAAHTWGLWNAGHKQYFSAGSDAHDVWHEPSGTARMYVHLDGKYTTEAFIDALKKGHSFASQGPLVYPETAMFGEELRHVAGTPLELVFSVQAVSGLSSVTLIERGKELQTQAFDSPVATTPVRFTVQPQANTWYSLVVQDANGRHAFTNPVWVTTTTGG